MIVALAGRRIDAAGAPLRFPGENISMVAEGLQRLFRSEGASAIVSSAACGADLIALREAGALNMRRRIVLPFAAASFRDSSVTDRPGDWGPLFDSIVSEVTAHSDVVTLDFPPGADASYAAANAAILDEAQTLSRLAGEPVCAVRVWEGQSRGAGDLTEAFGLAARARGLRVIDVYTLKTSSVQGQHEVL